MIKRYAEYQAARRKILDEKVHLRAEKEYTPKYDPKKLKEKYR